MGAISARVMLSWMGRRAMRGVAVAMMTLEIGCLLPPDHERPPDQRNFPPEIIRDSLEPAEPVFRQNFDQVDPRACRFTMRARIRDRNDNVVAIRWVTNNRTTLRRLIFEDLDFTITDSDAGRELPPQTFDPFDFEPPIIDEENPVDHTISLFVSDARAWDATREEIDEGTEKDDYGRPAILGDAGADDGTVVEMRWFVRFVNRSCP
jgi:hypothetical protein